MSKISSLATILVFFFLPAVTSGQGTATISGTVSDPSGAVVPGARVTVANIATGAERTASTDELGYYSIASLPPGEYAVEVQAPGFQRFRQTGITAQVDERLRVDAILQLGELSEVVSVTGEAVKVNTQDATMRSVIDAKRMVDLPLNGRTPLQLMLLSPGVVPAAPDVGGSFQPGGQQFASMSGSKTNSVNYVLDGGDNMDTYRSVANAFPNPDILQEFSVQTNNYSAEFGGRAGGVVNAVTKSGTNELHGTLFEFLRNNNLNATNFFANQDDGLKRNQFGGTVGGPVYFGDLYDGRNKTFFFFGAQQTTVRQRPNTATATVLTSLQRQGDFSDLFDREGNLVPISDPDTGGLFPNNRIPASRRDPVFQRFLEFVPVAEEPDGTTRFPTQNTSDAFQYSVRVDHNLGQSDRVFFRYFADRFEQPNTGIEGNILSFSNETEQDGTNATLNYQKVFSPSFLGTWSATFNRSDGLRGDVAPFTWDELGANIPPAGTSKDVLFFMPNFFNVVLFGDTPLVRNNYQHKTTMNWIKGRHNLKFGFEFTHRQFNIPIVNVQFHGRFVFNRTLSGSNAADGILGRPGQFLQTDGFRVELRQNDYALWVNDEIKLNNRTTLNLGLRWVPFRPWEDQWASIPQVAQFNPGRQSGVFANAPEGLLFFGDPGVPERVASVNNNRWAPRAALAFDPWGDGRTAVRMGYGVFWNQLLTAEQTQQFASQIPTFTTTANFILPPSMADPFAGQEPPFPAPVPKPRDFVFPQPVNNEIRMFSPDMTNSYVQQWNVTLERQIFGPGTLVRATYQGSKGTKLPVRVEQNPAAFIPGQSTRANIQDRRPFFPNFNSVKQIHPIGNSVYHALVLALEKRFTNNYSVLASYTFARNIDTFSNASSANGPNGNNPFDPHNDRGLADAHRQNAFVLSYVWEWPQLRDAHPAIRHIFGGWQNNGILSLYDGTPFTVVTGVDNSLSGVESDRPDLAGNPELPDGRSKGQEIAEFFNTDAFQPNALGTFGNAGRNILIGPGIATFDWSLFKNIPITEGQTLQFRSEFFNLFNRTNLNQPVSSLQSGAFGRIRSARDPRIIQFALKYIF